MRDENFGQKSVPPKPIAGPHTQPASPVLFEWVYIHEGDDFHIKNQSKLIPRN